ncbi:MAG: tetratricopeptide repeat protein [Candidatus Korobacteraceae bacterium]
MNFRKLTALGVMALIVVAPVTPAFAVSKEIIQLQTQVQDLADRITHMQQSFDERMGVMRSLVEQSTDNVNKLADSVQTMQKSLQQQGTDSQSKIDQVSGQIQTLNDSVDELKARLVKASKQLDDIQSQQQNIMQPAQPAAPAGAAVAPTGAAIQAPPADVLYNNALRDYNAARYELALSQFQDYIKYYPTTDLAGNAQFYIADVEYRSGNFEAAVADYDKVLEQFPGGNKAAAAQLKKGYSLIELGHREAGIRELNALVQRYPHTIEATQARERLKKLGAPVRQSSAHRSQ